MNQVPFLLSDAIPRVVSTLIQGLPPQEGKLLEPLLQQEVATAKMTLAALLGEPTNRWTMGVPGFGRRGLKTLRSVLSQHGLRLKTKPVQVMLWLLSQPATGDN